MRRLNIYLRSAIFACLPMLMFALSGCAFRSHVAVWASKPLIYNAIDAIMSETDISIAKTAMESNLKLLEGVIRMNPDDSDLLVQAARGYTGYAMMFLEDEEPQRATVIYDRAFQYGLRALSLHYEILNDETISFKDFSNAVDRLKKKDIDAAYWTATAWASKINLSKSSAQSIVELPRALLLMEWVAEQDENYFYSAPLWFLGVYYSSTPPLFGGNSETGNKYFQQALDRDGEFFLYGKLMYAKSYAVQTFDRELYEETLKEIISSQTREPAELRLLNAVAKQKAEVLLQQVDEVF